MEHAQPDFTGFANFSQWDDSLFATHLQAGFGHAMSFLMATKGRVLLTDRPAGVEGMRSSASRTRGRQPAKSGHRNFQ
jgi:hypothetical protein